MFNQITYPGADGQMHPVPGMVAQGPYGPVAHAGPQHRAPWFQWLRDRRYGARNMMQTRRVERSGNLTESSLATIYGCCGLFDLCSDADLMSLSFEGTNPFLDWIGWERTLECEIRKNFITWQRPEHSQGSPTGGYVSDPCADPNGIEWGECDFLLDDFARLRRGGPVRDITEVTGLKLCEAQPRYRLDGTPITDDREYDMRVTLEVLMQDLKRMIVNGNSATPGQFDGLQQLVNNAYVNSSGRRCAIMDSLIVNWGGNDLSGGAGITLNGNAVGASFNFVDVLLYVYRVIKQRIGWAPALAAQPLSVGDIVLALPTQLARCLLDHYTCWSVCDGSQYNEVALQSFEARTFRNSLNGGLFGDGRIFLDGFEVPLLTYDWGLINSPTLFDAYLLTGSVGSIKTIQGQYLDMSGAGQARSDRFAVTDGGRLLMWAEDDHTCEQRIIEMRPRILSWAPWANVRFQNVQCRQPGGPLSPDPTETSFFPESSFSVADCD